MTQTKQHMRYPLKNAEEELKCLMTKSNIYFISNRTSTCVLIVCWGLSFVLLKYTYSVDSSCYFFFIHIGCSSILALLSYFPLSRRFEFDSVIFCRHFAWPSESTWNDFAFQRTTRIREHSQYVVGEGADEKMEVKGGIQKNLNVPKGG